MPTSEKEINKKLRLIASSVVCYLCDEGSLVQLEALKRHVDESIRILKSKIDEVKNKE